MDQNGALTCEAPHSARFDRCEDEPIATPGATQPHGALVVVNLRESRISHVSGNCESLLGLTPQQLMVMAPAELASALHIDPTLLRRHSQAMHAQQVDLRADTAQLGASPAGLHPTAEGLRPEPGTSGTAAAGVCRNRTAGDDAHESEWHLGAARNARGEPFTAQVASRGEQLFLELEPAAAPEADSAPLLAHAMQRMSRAQSSHALFEETVEAVRCLTGFDRICMYVFDRAWHGEVVAERVREGCMQSLGLRFPSTDIPRQARALYARTPLRAVVDVEYVPVPVVCRQSEQAPLDLSICTLRSLSPIHREYVRNFSARASLSLSVMAAGRLYGLISCNHEAGPKWVSPARRQACCAVVGMLSGMLGRSFPASQGDTSRALVSGLIRKMSRLVDVSKLLAGDAPNMLSVTNAEGAAMLFNDQLTTCGDVPPDTFIQGLIQWLRDGPLHEGVFVTDSLPAVHAEAKTYRNCSCGLLAVATSDNPTTVLLWFRPEIAKTVLWGGKKHQADDDAMAHLRPRSSFERWQEAVSLHAEPFSDDEIESAKLLAREVEQALVRQSVNLARANAELEHSNRELDAFAHAASHDLKEPLRGVQNFVSLAQRELEEGKQAESIAMRLESVQKLTHRMNTLISALLHYAEVGRSALETRPTALGPLIEPLLETLRRQPGDRTVTFDMADSLPLVLADQALLREVFTNLFTNAIKYNTHDEVCICVGCVDSDNEDLVTLFVRDNGIGVAQKHQQAVFEIFRRLHGRDKFGGGSGTGLTIAKRIVEQHGGTMWISSRPGEGSTFYFSMHRAQSDNSLSKGTA